MSILQGSLSQRAWQLANTCKRVRPIIGNLIGIYIIVLFVFMVKLESVLMCHDFMLLTNDVILGFVTSILYVDNW